MERFQLWNYVKWDFVRPYGVNCLRRHSHCVSYGASVTGTFVPTYFRSQERKYHRWNFRSLVLSLPGTFVPWNFRSRERKLHGTFAPWNFRSQELSFPGTFAPWYLRSRVLSLPGTFVPWNFRSLEHSLPNAISKTWSFLSPCFKCVFLSKVTRTASLHLCLTACIGLYV